MKDFLGKYLHRCQAQMEKTLAERRDKKPTPIRTEQIYSEWKAAKESRFVPLKEPGERRINVQCAIRDWVRASRRVSKLLASAHKRERNQQTLIGVNEALSAE